MGRGRLFFKNAFIMSGTALLLRLLGIGFNVYLAARMGASGVGLLTLIMSVYALAVTFATSGIGVAATRLTAESLAVGDGALAVRSMRICLAYSVVLGIVSFALMYMSAPFIGGAWLSDTRTVLPLRLLATVMPMLSVSSVIGGYFTAVRRVIKSSAVLIIEQVIRIAVTVILLSGRSRSVADACTCIAVASIAGEAFSFIVLTVLYAADIRRHRTGSSPNVRVARKLLHISLPIACNAYLRAGVFTLNQLMIPAGLMRFGLTEETALSQYGIISAMVFPVLHLPQTFLYAFSGMLVPEFSESAQCRDAARIKRMLAVSVKVTLIFAAAVCGVLITLSDEIAGLLYDDPLVTVMLVALAPIVMIMYLDCVVDAALSGLDQQVPSMWYNMSESLVCTGMIYFLLPLTGAWGYVLALFLGKAVNMALSVLRLAKTTGFRFDMVRLMLTPFLCACTAFICAGLMRGLAFSAVWLPCALMFVLIYIMSLRLTGCASRKDAVMLKSYLAN